MLTPRVELFIASIFLLLIALGLYFTSQIDLAFSSDLETFSGPRAYPRLILLVLLALTLLPALRQIRALLRPQTDTPGFETFFDQRAVLSVALFVALLIFVLTLEPVGYILTMVPLLVVVALLCGATSPTRALFASIGLTALCLIIFRYGLSTVLPEGIFGIDAAF